MSVSILHGLSMDNEFSAFMVKCLMDDLEQDVELEMRSRGYQSDEFLEVVSYRRDKCKPIKVRKWFLSSIGWEPELRHLDMNLMEICDEIEESVR